MLQEENPTIRLLSYRELILTLQKLCKEQQSGVMIINSDSGNIAKLTLEQGVIFDVSFGDITGTSALLLIKKITQGKASFFKRALGNATQHIELSTAEILNLLLDIEQAAPVISQPSPIQENIVSTQKHVATEEQLLIIEAYLAIIIGPVARIIYADYKEEIQRADNLSTLSSVIEKIARQVLMTEQQLSFKQAIREFIQYSGLKNEQSILTVIKSAGRTIKLNPSTLALCISKHTAQGEAGSALLAKLATQIEAAGNLVGLITLANLLKFLEKTTKTGLLAINAQGRKAAFYFDQGKLINAIEADKHGVVVALDVLQWKPEKITFATLAKVGVTREIHQTVTNLLNSSRSGIISKEDGLKFTQSTSSTNNLQDALAKEIERLQSLASDRKTDTKPTETEYQTLIAHAIHLAESYDNVSAEQLLNRVLMDHDNSYKGWLWLEKVLTSMTVIEFALKKAAYLDPKSSELTDEVKKFMAARRTIKGDFVLRCPFCWMPVREKDNECPHCLASFFIESAFFNKVGKAKTDILDRAINRYNNALQQDTSHSGNVYLHFYLAMAYINRQYYQEGLAQFNEIIGTLPENRTFIQQKLLLRQYMQTTGLISAPVQQTSQDQDSTLTKAKILVVEDSMVTRKVIARTLTANGYEVMEAKDANEALADIEEKNPDLVLLDIILPGRSGYEILAEIKTMPKLAKVPVIMLTSRDSLFDKLKGKVSDANEYLTKPFQPDELLMIVKKYLK